jgi:hypothetical protein
MQLVYVNFFAAADHQSDMTVTATCWRSLHANKVSFSDDHTAEYEGPSCR